MAIVPFSKKIIGGGNGVLITWPDLGEGDEGQPIDLVEFSDRVVQVVGECNGGGVAIEGSLDGSAFATLSNAHGFPLQILTPRIDSVGVVTPLARPRVTGGSPRLTVHLLLRK